MTDETPRCEPPPELRGHDWFHWLEADAPTIGRWYAATDFSGEAWRINSHQRSAQGAHRAGYRYLAPVTPPAVVAALVKALEGMMVGSQWKEPHIFIDNTPIGAGWQTIRMPTDEAMTAARAALAAYKEAGR